MAEIQHTALAMGAFDGLHRGHKKVIQTAINEAEFTPAVLTFKEDPSIFLKNECAYLEGEEQKLEILKNYGVEQVFLLDFLEIKDMEAEEFFYKILLKQCGAKVLVCGSNFRFGKKASGDIVLLEKLCLENNIKLIVVTFEMQDGEIISSTRIRIAIQNGDIKLANKLLGRNFDFQFEVVAGNKIGRTLGTPTINQPLPVNYVKPKFGVYASIVTVHGTKYYGVTNIGVKPSIGKYDPLSETWIPDVNFDMYGMNIRVELIDFIRPEVKFDTIEELKNEIFANAKSAKEIFLNYNKNK